MRLRRGWLVAVPLALAGCGSAAAGQTAGGTPASARTTATTQVSTTEASSLRPTSANPSPQPLADCGPAPKAYGDSRQLIGVSLTGPATAVSGSVLHLQVHLHSLDGVQHVFEGGSGSALVLLHGRVVGEYEGALAASGITVTVGAAAQPVLDAATLLAGCPDRPVDMVAPDLTRKALPPGPYDVVAVLPDADGQLVTPPLRVQVTADPHALPTCGDVPVSTEPPQSRVSGELTGPAQAKAGSTVRLQVQLRSNQGKPEPLETGLPADVLVVRGGYVVGRTDGPVAGVGLDLTVPAQGTIPLLSEEDQRNPLLAADVTLAGCPQPSGHATAVSASPRKPLPPGTYQLVAAIEDNGHGAPGVLVTQPLTVQVT